ncbi:ThuA domain-containing protein [Reichenbachiella ulvae]|uniref:ThuA domain-containing protein n=1 Tax=Reichenbachiella ulvae TaxID=2980104 RepID=A0ABT3CXC0_9BACT|nr:ThuA domain-containing protein [Reichenbachiella ulvae]MCV9388277.1 ThuA domain-containing protein [Reichenbachiella ulvae]
MVFSKTVGYRHASIETGVKCIEQLGYEHQFLVDHSEEAAVFLSDSLSTYDAVIFLSSSGDIFNSEQEKAFQSYVKAGGAVMGIHGATTTEYEWPWFNQLMGAYFDNHPEIQTADFDVVDPNHPSTRQLPTRFQMEDEFYNFYSIQPGLKPLIRIDESSYEGGKHGDNHPIAWYHTFEGSRVFYTALGHRKELYQDSVFVQHLMGGISYVLRRED